VLNLAAQASPEAVAGVSAILIAVGLVVAALVLIFLEGFVPSGGLLSVAAIACAVGAVAVAFSVGPTTGVAFLVAAVLLMPVALYYALRLLRRTSMVTEPSPGGGDGTPVFAPGTSGVTASILRPSGVAMIDGRKRSVVTQGEIIEKDVKIEVVRCEGNRVVVRSVPG